MKLRNLLAAIPLLIAKPAFSATGDLSSSTVSASTSSTAVGDCDGVSTIISFIADNYTFRAQGNPLLAALGEAGGGLGPIASAALGFCLMRHRKSLALIAQAIRIRSLAEPRALPGLSSFRAKASSIQPAKKATDKPKSYSSHRLQT